ncbi:methylenetetrahydrofolate reductase [Curtobacterium pusillum]|uniref:methylenetetrahydrofolate reductase n=1 Tax=Curtobacterium pusillum TaxID=69373 RepID=UPI0015856146|nr:methylenetetrahydrofolate reductase [Curtobacterium pusillum]GLK30679.1 methylenetetrahydrofolate reductase [Curtobacterium pusillum]
MSSPTTGTGTDVRPILADFSVEMTAKDVDAMLEAAPSLPPGTRINVTFLGNEDAGMRRAAARAVRDAGFRPVPHISARRIADRDELDDFVGALHADGTSDSLFVIAGDPPEPIGPYDGAIDVITSGIVGRYGVRCVGVGGYPEGHPLIPEADLWSSLEQKVAAIAEAGAEGEIITQFGFDVDAVLRWVDGVRQRGIDLPIRIGVPGPAGIKRLVGYARRFGVGTSAGIAKKYGFSITNLLGTAGPDRFITELAAKYDEHRHGAIALHFYTFGGLRATAEWIQEFRKESAR